MSSTCVFCRKFRSASATDERDWFDAELTSVPGSFVIVPGLGSFREGYLMILTRDHYRCIGELPVNKLRKLEVVKHNVRNVLTRVYQAPIIFEHGPVLSTGRGGSCIDHAHLQILPLEIDLLPILREQYPMELIDDLSPLAGFAAQGESYLYYENQLGQMYVCEAENVPSQYIRRVIAAELGRPTEWDYALFPHYELITATIETLCPWPSDGVLLGDR